MAVIKNRRSVSSLEFERVFQQLYNYTRNKMASVPKRRWKSIARPILDQINSAYVAVMGVTYDPVKGDKQYMLIKYQTTVRAITLLLGLQKPLDVYWAISGTSEEPDIKRQPTDKREYWCDMINHEINLLLDILKKNPNYNPLDAIEPNPIHAYNNYDVSKSILLSQMRDLLRYTHSKAIRASRIMSDAEMDILVWLVDDAWFHLLEGNRKIPETRDEYATRRSHFSKTISDLVKMNRPLVSVFCTEFCSERVIEEWSSKLNELLKICYRVQESDRKRFGSLHS